MDRGYVRCSASGLFASFSAGPRPRYRAMRLNIVVVGRRGDVGGRAVVFGSRRLKETKDCLKFSNSLITVTRGISGPCSSL